MQHVQEMHNASLLNIEFGAHSFCVHNHFLTIGGILLSLCSSVDNITAVFQGLGLC
jgi:hypothetical protein